jgi:hypothetical protein
MARSGPSIPTILAVSRTAKLARVARSRTTRPRRTSSVWAIFRGSLGVRVDAVVAAAPTLDEPCRRSGDDPPVNLRWVLMHLLEETARHAGHADILRETVDGSTGR